MREDCKASYGNGKQQIYNRWIRAATGISAVVLRALRQHPKFPGNYVWDSSWLLATRNEPRNKLSADYALKAIRLSQEEKMNEDVFIKVVCKGLRLLELWRTLVEKRYGCVASNCQALARLCERLDTMADPRSIMACAATGLNLHGNTSEQQEIP